MNYLYYVLIGVAVATLILAGLLFASSRQWTYERARNDLENEMVGRFNENMIKHRIIYETKQLFEEMISEYEQKNKLNR